MADRTSLDQISGGQRTQHPLPRSVANERVRLEHLQCVIITGTDASQVTVRMINRSGRVPSLVEKRNCAFFRLVQLTTNAPPGGRLLEERAGLEAWRVRSLADLDVI